MLILRYAFKGTSLDIFVAMVAKFFFVSVLRTLKRFSKTVGTASFL